MVQSMLGVDARTVEIEVYSTVGTSAWGSAVWRSFGVKCGKGVGAVCDDW